MSKEEQRDERPQPEALAPTALWGGVTGNLWVRVVKPVRGEPHKI